MRTVVERYFETELDARLLLQLMTVKLQGGEWLFHQGDPGNSLYLVVRGRLQAWMSPQGTRAGGRMQLLGEMVAGDSLGEVGLISGEPRAAGIRAIRDSLLVRVDQESFGRLAEAHPSLGLKLAANVAAMLQKNLAGTETSHHAYRTVALQPLRGAQEARALCREICHRLQGEVGARVLAPELLTRKGAPNPESVNAEQLSPALRDWLSDQEYDYPMVVYSCEGDDNAWTRFALRQSDLVLLVAPATASPALTPLEATLLADAEKAPAGSRAVILIHGIGEEINGTRAWLELRKPDFHLHFRAGGPSLAGLAGRRGGSAGNATVGGDLNRILRVITGKATGLVLSGGAMRTMAQLGVFKAIREAGIDIDWVGGTSIGSIIAAAIARDWDPDEAIVQARRAFVEGKPFSDLTIPVISLLRGENMRKLLENQLDSDIEDLPLPYFCISSNLDRGVQNVHESGGLVSAIRASSAIPGVMPPAVVGHELAVDGSVLNNLPVDVMRRKPVGRVLAVDASALDYGTVEYPETPSPWKVLLERWLPGAKQQPVPSLSNVLLKSTEISTLLKSRELGKLADLLFHPPVEHFSLTDVNAFDDIVASGYQYARARLREWQQLKTDEDTAPEAPGP